MSRWLWHSGLLNLHEFLKHQCFCFPFFEHFVESLENVVLNIFAQSYTKFCHFLAFLRANGVFYSFLNESDFSISRETEFVGAYALTASLLVGSQVLIPVNSLAGDAAKLKICKHSEYNRRRFPYPGLRIWAVKAAFSLDVFHASRTKKWAAICPAALHRRIHDLCNRFEQSRSTYFYRCSSRSPCWTRQCSVWPVCSAQTRGLNLQCWSALVNSVPNPCFKLLLLITSFSF